MSASNTPNERCVRNPENPLKPDKPGKAASAARRSSDVCAFEAKLALMNAALHAATAREQRDDLTLALWRRRADEARDWLRAAHGDEAEEAEHVAA